MSLLSLAAKSLGSRRASAFLTLFSIALSTALLVGVEKIRHAARAGFEQTVSGTDLIVGARSGSINLLLYSIFRLGDATANVSWQSYEGFSQRPDVAWTVPLSLGDSHKGYRVLGTNKGYFEHYQYGAGRKLAFTEGVEFTGVFDAVLGAEVAAKLGYALGDDIVIAHGLKSTAFSEHKDRPFHVAGILKATGTPVDRTIHISLEGIEAVHIGWESGGPSMRSQELTSDEIKTADLQPEAITAFLVGLKSKAAVLRFQRDVNTFPREALLAVIPGVALAQLWEVVGAAETALRAIAVFVVAAGLMGMMTTILSSLNERRREIAVLRAVGARAGDIFALLSLESGLLAGAGALLGTMFINVVLILGRPIITQRFNAPLGDVSPSMLDLTIVVGVAAMGFFLGLIPGWRAYRNSLADGLTARI